MQPVERTHDASIPITIDDRELRGPVQAALAASGRFDVYVRRLPFGDYLVDDALVFERKTLFDLVASIKQGRLFEQAARLANCRRPVALILEGRGADLANSGMRWQAIQGALLSLTMVIGVPLLRSRSPAETVSTFALAAQQHRRLAHRALPRRGQRPQGKQAYQHYLLQGLPAIGPDRAARLLRAFGSVQAVVDADETALAQVAGIGRRIAGKIRWAVDEPAAGYTSMPIRSEEIVNRFTFS